MSRSFLLAILAMFLLPAVAMAGPNPGIGYLAGSVQAGTVPIGEQLSYQFTIQATAPDGKDAVHLDFDFVSGSNRIAPVSIIEMRASDTPDYTGIGTLEGFDHVVRQADVATGGSAAGQFIVRVTSTLDVAVPGEYTSYLRIVARDTTAASSSPGIIYQFNFDVTGTVAPVPDAVTGLHATGVQATSVSLAWNAVPGAASYEVHRGLAADFPLSASSLRGTVNGLTFHDAGLAPESTHVYRVRALNADGVAGAASTALQLQTPALSTSGPGTDDPGTDGASGGGTGGGTGGGGGGGGGGAVPEPEPKLPAVAIRDLRLDVGPTVVASWQSSAAAGSAFLFGPMQQRIDAGTGTSFQADLGALPAGTYAYRIEAGASVLAGTFAIQQAPQTKWLAQDVLEDLAGLGIALPNSLFLVDEGSDGTIDAVEDASGDLALERAFPVHGLFLMRGERLALVDISGAAHAVSAVEAKVSRVEHDPYTSLVFLETPERAGWKLVSVADPEGELIGLLRGDDFVDLDFVWNDGRVHFLDDGSGQYVLQYGASEPVTEASSEGPPAWAWPAAGAALLGGVGAVVLVARRLA